MNGGRSELTATAEELRRTFDEAFARPPETPAGNVLDFLAIRAGSGRYALRVSDLAGLEGRRKIVPLPSTDPALLGVTGAQGRLVPVYRLASLVGGDGADEEPAWLAICGREEPAGLAFSALDGHLRVLPGELYQPAKDDPAFVREALRLPSEVRYVLDVPAILTSIRQRAGLDPATGR